MKTWLTNRAPEWLLLAISLLYCLCLGNGFVNIDDDPFIVQNTWLSLSFWDVIAEVFSSSYQGHYQPITWLVYWFLHLISDSPLPFHVISVVLHVLNAQLLYKIIKQWVTKKQAFWATFFFVIHPVQVESIAWASALSTPLYTLFGLLALNSYFNHSEKTGSAKRWLLPFIFCLAAVLSKSMGVVFPLIIVFTEVVHNKAKSNRVLILSLLGLIPGFVYIAVVSAKQFGSLGIEHSVGPFELISASIGFYIHKFLFPDNLSVFYPIGTQTYFRQNGLYMLFCLLFILILLHAIVKKRRSAFFGVCALISIAPIIKWTSFGDIIGAHRYAYVFVPFFVLWMIAWVGEMQKAAMRSPLKKMVAKVIIALFIMVCGIQSFHQIKTWKNSINLYRNAVYKEPTWNHARMGLGIAYMDDDKYHRALFHLKKALEFGPATDDLHFHLGIVYLKLNRLTQAKIQFEKSIHLNASQTRSYTNLAGILMNQANYSKALIYFKKAYALEGSITNLENLIYCSIQCGELEYARKLIRQLPSTSPQYSVLQNMLN